MILTIIMFVYGLLMLIRGKGMGKDAVAHPQYRWLGGFLLTYVPAQLIAGIILAVVLVASDPNMSADDIEKRAQVPSIIVSVALLVVYLAIAHFWEKAIKRKALAQPA